MQAIVMPEKRVTKSPKPKISLNPRRPPTSKPIPAPISPQVTNHQTMCGNPKTSALASVTGSFEIPCCKNRMLIGILKRNCAIGAGTLGILIIGSKTQRNFPYTMSFTCLARRIRIENLSINSQYAFYFRSKL